tara:strand:- start:252 stop:989 length:738 start_codon:yes stop_codon:yes gene_type:complete
MYRYIITIFIIFYINYIFKEKTCEKYYEEEILKPSNESDELNIKINKDIIRKMNHMKSYINGQSKQIPEIYNNLPPNYKNRKTYIKLLYETYVDDFLDVYIVNRFNAHKFIDIKYKYPSFENSKNNYEKIYKDLLEPSISYFHQNINTNLDHDFFYFTLKDNKYEEIKYLIKEIKGIPLNKFKTFYESNNFRGYFNKIFKNMNMEMIDDNEYPFTFKYKNINNNNISEIKNSIDDFLENEKNNLK